MSPAAVTTATAMTAPTAPTVLRLAAVALAVALTGCANTMEPKQIPPSAQFAPVLPVPSTQARAATGSLFDERVENLYGRKRDYRVGDIVTVILDEQTQASRNASTTTARESTNDALPSIKAGVGDALAHLPLGKGLRSAVNQLKVDGNTITSTGTGDAGQRATLRGQIAVTVVDVLANGNLIVRGEKQLSLSEGSEVIQVAGIVRVEDVAPNGTVQSRRLANAQITYRGTGDLAAASAPGWGTRFLNRYWPF